MPEGCYDGIVKGMYLFKDAGASKNKKIPRVQLLAAGGSVLEAVKAAELLDADFGVKADVWSCPSFTELARDGYDCERWNRLHPQAKQPRVSHLAQCLVEHKGPVVAVSEYVRAVTDQVHAFVPAGRRFVSMGADGYGRSDTRDNLRGFFEIDRYWIAHAAISALAADGEMNPEDVARAIRQYKLDPDKPNPITM